MSDEKYTDAFMRTCQSLFNTANRDKGSWVSIVRKVIPELIPASELQDDVKSNMGRICSHARVDILNLATAHMSYIFPEGQRWFRFEPWERDDTYDISDEDGWFAQCTDVATRELARSNFQTEMNNVCVDRCVTGTGLMLIEMDPKEDVLVFTHIPAGTYAVAQDSQHNVNTVVRKFNYTPAQMVEAFGEDNVPAEVKAQYEKEEERYNAFHEVWHLVAPSRDFFHDVSSDVLEANPYVSVYIAPQTRTILDMGTIFEFPYMCTRFIRYGNSAYGQSPLANVKDVIDDLMTQEDVMKMIAQRSAVPSVIIPADMEGEVDLRAGGQTIIPMQYINSQVPREWAPPTNYQVGIDQIERLKAEIDVATHVNMLQVISNTDRYMTATEVSERSAERVHTFYPSFAQCQTDARAMWNRVFALLMRAGKFSLDDMPQWVVQLIPHEDGYSERVISPKVAYTGRMQQMMERVISNNSDAFLAKMLQLMSATQDPTPMAIFDMLKYCLGEAYANGIPTRYLRKPDEVKRELDKLQKMQLQQQQMQQEAAAAAANRDNAAAENYRAQYGQTNR